MNTFKCQRGGGWGEFLYRLPSPHAEYLAKVMNYTCGKIWPGRDKSCGPQEMASIRPHTNAKFILKQKNSSHTALFSQQAFRA